MLTEGFRASIADDFQALVEETERILEGWKHPEPYIPPTAPGGTKYERNLPPPILDRWSPNRTVCAVLTLSSTTPDGCVIVRQSLQIEIPMQIILTFRK